MIDFNINVQYIYYPFDRCRLEGSLRPPTKIPTCPECTPFAYISLRPKQTALIFLMLSRAIPTDPQFQYSTNIARENLNVAIQLEIRLGSIDQPWNPPSNTGRTEGMSRSLVVML